MTSARLPRMLDNSMQEIRRLVPLALSCTLTQLHDGFPTAGITLLERDEMPARAFVEVYGVNGSLGVYRVDAVAAAYGESREYRLTHALSTLQDDVIVGQGEFTGTPGELLDMVINAQTVKRWKAGTVEPVDNIKEPITYDNSNAYDSLKTLLTLLPGYTIAVDMAEYPWTINIVKQDDTILSEGRLSRNIASLRTDADFSEICTRLYLDGSTRYWDADTIDTWGVISRNFSTGSEIDDDAGEDVINAYLDEKAAEYFDLHKNPTISIEIDGFDLSERTGQPLDSFAPGNMYRLALPDYGTTLNERVVTVAYADLLGAPERATVSLSNRTEDATTRMAGLMVSVQKITASYEKFVDQVNTELSLRVHYDDWEIKNAELEHVISTVEVNLDAVESTLELKAERTELQEQSQRLTEALVLIDANAAAIELKASQTDVDEMKLLVNDNKMRISAAEVAIDGANAAIALKANATSVTALETRMSSAEVAIDGANAEIALKVDKDGVIAAINVSSEEVTIKASKINLSGYVTTSKLSSELASITNQISTSISTSSISAANAYFTNIEFGGAALRLRTQSFVTAAEMPTFYGKYITYTDDTMDVVQQYVLTGVKSAGSVTTESLVYCSVN